MTSLTKTLIIILVSGIIVFIERAFPFILFSKKNPPKIISLIEKYIPSIVMPALLFYCIKDINFIQKAGEIIKIDFHNSLPYISGLITAVSLHIWKRNSLISIFGATAIYMILIRIL